MYKADNAPFRIVWRRSLHIHSTLESVTTSITLLTPCFIQTLADSMWFVPPQLFFHCTLRPIGAVTGRFNRSDDDIPLDLIFFSPFEVLGLRTAGIMKSKGIHRVY